ncbi:hypothetical protein BRI6_4088 [plant metagenome]|uniref:Colicin n=1 Tax=plant metagenome TaxID=1297885 RepID=A0A484VJ25_9ZZZZ
MKIPDWLLLVLWRSMIGEVYPDIRAVAVSLSDERQLTIRYYLDREPTDFDWESLEVVATNLSAQVGLDKIAHVELECQFSDQPLGKLDFMDGVVYSRREYDMPA